ncbi:MAG: fluoride efflux transporter FluC [Pseudoxanthomonas sp.]
MSSPLLQAVAVAIGGAAGALLRHGVNLLLPRSAQHAFSVSTLTVNAVGCFFAGLLLVWILQRDDTDFWRALLLTGLMGGLTTFSAFGLDLLQLARAERWAWLGLTVLLHVALGLAAVLAGWRLGQSVWPTPG